METTTKIPTKAEGITPKANNDFFDIAIKHIENKRDFANAFDFYECDTVGIRDLNGSIISWEELQALKFPYELIISSPVENWDGSDNYEIIIAKYLTTHRAKTNER
jgi:hypothetical protein